MTPPSNPNTLSFTEIIVEAFNKEITRLDVLDMPYDKARQYAINQISTALAFICCTQEQPHSMLHSIQRSTLYIMTQQLKQQKKH